MTARAEPAAEEWSASTANLHQWGAVTLFHGLPSDRVRAIAQGPDGAMWFGTDGGLARYDGRRMQVVAADNFSIGRVLALRFDADGALWIGTDDGAARYIEGIFKPIAETAGQTIVAIVMPERGRAVLAGRQGTIFDCRVKEDSSLVVRTITASGLPRFEPDGGDPFALTSLGIVGDRIFIGSRRRGLLMLERDEIKEVPNRPRPFFIEAIETGEDGRLWFGAQVKGAEGGLYEAVDPLRPARAGLATGTITALRSDGRGAIWIGTSERGAVRYRGPKQVERFTFDGTAGGLRSDRIFAIFVDQEGVVWFGTDRGVCRYDPQSPRVERLAAEPESNFVRALYRAQDGRVWCGTRRGLFAYDEALRGWSPVSDLAGKTIYAIGEDAAGRLLVGSANGLYARGRPPDEALQEPDAPDPASEAKTFSYINPAGADLAAPAANDSIRAITVFRGAAYVASFGRGVERVEGFRRTLIWPVDQADARAREVVSLYADGHGRMWIGTARSGLFVFDGTGVTAARGFEILQNRAVWSMAESGDGRLWFATERGLYCYRAGQLTVVVPDVDARSVAVGGSGPNGSRLWCATAGGGLFKVSFDEHFGTLTSKIDTEQGMPSQNIFAVLPSMADGHESLLIGTSRGLARYVAGEVAPRLHAVRIIGKRVYQPEEIRGTLDLEYPQNSLVIDVAAISSRTFPEHFQYAFLLLDSSGRVIRQKFSRDPQFLMESLPPGQYRVVARAFSADLVASRPLTFAFSIAKAPFPWTTASLSVLLGLALTALLWGYWQNRKMARTSAQLAQANHQLAAARLQLANEAETERRRIARDLHDQTLADLRGLLMLTDQLPAKETGNGHSSLDPAIFRAEIESVSQEIRRICEDLSPSVLENVGLTAALEWALSEAVAHLPEPDKFTYEFLCDEGLEDRLRLAPGERMQIYRIAQEAISNVCRHAAATHVRVAVAVSSEDSLVLTIEDNGRGFDGRHKRANTGRGLANIRARASLIEADVRWTERPGGGTIFTMRKAQAITADGGTPQRA